MMALAMIVTLSQCRKPDVETEDNEENTPKVRISCTIPINKDSRTDFTNILENGTVNWSAETERIYLALPDHETIVELTSTSEEGGKTLTFTGSVQPGLLEDGKTYDVWYLGRSEKSKLAEGSITGSIATQSGNLSDLGYHHIAKATVTASVGDGITLNFNGNFKNQIAIVRLGDESASTNILRGNAIIGTDYSLQYDGEKFELAVTESAYANISVAPQTEDESYVVVFPNTNNNVELMSDSGKKVTFLNGVKAGGMYTVGWEEYEGSNGYEYVDLGLPSGLKWAKYNVGANTAEAYGDYFAWGEIAPKTSYGENNSKTYGKEMGNISGNTTYDAATVNWGENWRIPTQGEMQELIDNCTWTWTQQNGVNGYNVTGANGKSIFLPAAGSYDSGGGVFINERGSYWTSTPTTIEENQKAYYLVFLSTNKIVGSNYRDNGRVVRPVTGGEFESPAAQYAEVTTAEVSGITISTAVCGGNVTVDKYSEVRERGVCYSTSQNPTISDNIKSATPPASGAYTVELTGLQMNTTYYVRAYATTDAGISYGEVKSFTTANIGVITSDVTNITTSTAVCGGEVIANSEGNIFRGIYWGTSADFIHNIMMYPATDGAEYTVELTGLKPNTTYYVKAYATFNNNEYYGEVKSFTTLDYEYVDLGLPSGTLWATQNVGATTPQEKGNSYKWGATEVGGASYNGFEDISGTQYDAATANWNSDWRMPTREQMIELHEKCTWEYEGTGYRVIGPNKNEIFLPNTEPVHITEGYYSCYWTSQPISPGSVALRFNNGIHELYIISKDNACAIRPVRK